MSKLKPFMDILPTYIFLKFFFILFQKTVFNDSKMKLRDDLDLEENTGSDLKYGSWKNSDLRKNAKRPTAEKLNS